MLAVLDPGVYLTLALPTGEGKLFTLALVIEGKVRVGQVPLR